MIWNIKQFWMVSNNNIMIGESLFGHSKAVGSDGNVFP